MRFLRLVYANIRRLLAQPSNLLMIILLPALILVFQSFIIQSGSSLAGKVVVINEDKGSLSEEALLASDLRFTLIEDDKQAGLERLESYESEVLFVIPENYTESIRSGQMPKIERYSVNESTLYDLMDQNLTTAVRYQLQEKLFGDYGLEANEILLTESTVKSDLKIAEYSVSFDYLFSMLMIIYFIIIFSSNTGGDLLELRNQKVTTRMFLTPSSSLETMTALAISYFLLTFSGYAIVSVLAYVIFGIQDAPLGMTLLIIALTSFFALSLSLFLAKISKNKQVMSLVPVLYGLLGVMGAVLSFMGRDELFTKIGYIAPPYWLAQMMMTVEIIKNAGIVLLMALLLLTAGSYDFQKFVED